ncbi:nitric oxide synthase oxygenase [Kineosporia babensis]|uniref:Nitric oxide synthase oxygenase n=1 Tax=Kineosporia babensis TaxID=499548 RepID=A0A9X1NAZ2_9ACTN|nr:nitric oxide synthase oxygenase [Kineosporia babensis]MCD5310471.1 nitric oxide synthase oxygenase [Kineosporia babensis]
MTQQNLHRSSGYGADGYESAAPTVQVKTSTAPAGLPLAPIAAPEHPMFRPTKAYRHDTQRPAIDPDRVVAEWRLMYEWLERDPEMVTVCGFDPADLTPHAQRMRLVELIAEVGPGRTFTVHPAEMQFWVRYSWINSDRCSGRQHALQHAVIQYRPEVRSAVDMLKATVEHADLAMTAPVPPQTVITVLGMPTPPGELGQMFVTEQMLRAAGYRTGDGEWTGDGGYLDVTDWVRSYNAQHLIEPMPGYRPGSFDVLPMIAMGAAGELVMAPVPNISRYLIDIPWPRHPESEGPADDSGYGEPFACWPAIPLQTNFDLDIAGQRYCTIFNGWYVDEELATNFLDTTRYNWAGRISEAIHGPIDEQMLSATDRFDEYRMAQVEIATLRAIRAGFKSARMKMNNLTASQSGFAKFCQRHLTTHGEMPPNDTGWTSNRVGSRYRFPSYPVPHAPQVKGAALVKHWLSVKSLRPGVPVHVVDLDKPNESMRYGRHAKFADSPVAMWSDDEPAAPRGCPVGH